MGHGGGGGVAPVRKDGYFLPMGGYFPGLVRGEVEEKQKDIFKIVVDVEYYRRLYAED